MRYNVHFLHVVRYPWKLQLNHVFVGYVQTCPSLPNLLKITKCQYLCEGLSYFVHLLHVAHIYGSYSVIMPFQLCMVLHAQSSLKQQIASISGKGLVILLLIFCMQLFASCKIFIEATKICYFGLALSGIGCQPIRLSDVLNLKNLKTL